MLATTGDSDHGGCTPITTIHPSIIQSHILNRLDGQTLASTSCASAQFLSLCSEDLLWRQICNFTWPATTHPTVHAAVSAFPSGHRSFYSDAFPSVRCHNTSGQRSRIRSTASRTSELISAVDIFYDDKLVYSKVIVTETRSGWFLSSPFRVELLSHKETVPTALSFNGDDGACTELARERLKISWILIDPLRKRAANIASVKAVEARRHWLTEDVQLRYGTVVAVGDDELVQCAVVVNCGGKDGGEMQVREVSMQVEDMDGKILTGLDGLRILETAMDGERRKSDVTVEKGIYENFLRMKIQCRERKQRRERRLDMACIAVGILFFFAIWTVFLWR